MIITYFTQHLLKLHKRRKGDNVSQGETTTGDALNHLTLNISACHYVYSFSDVYAYTHI